MRVLGLSAAVLAVAGSVALATIGVATAAQAGIAAPAGTPGTATLTFPATMTFPGTAPVLPWPTSGHARLEVAGIGEFGHSGNTKAASIASVTKVMTAYVVLKDHPLATGRNGSKITVSSTEAKAYTKEKANGESVVKVAAGEKITERQALQGLLLPSGNNMAEILGRWDAGSDTAFVKKMNAKVTTLKLTSTHFADTSGFDKNSKSTTADLLVLAPAAMADKTFAQIVAEKSATIPLNKVTNRNTLLGKDGVIGIKTGSMSASGGCLVFASRLNLGGSPLTMYGAVLGTPGTASTILPNVLSESDKLIVAATGSVGETTLIQAGQTVATVLQANGTTTAYVLSQPLTVAGWPGVNYKLSLPAGLKPGQAPATLTVTTPAGKKTTLPLTGTPQI